MYVWDIPALGPGHATSASDDMSPKSTGVYDIHVATDDEHARVKPDVRL